MPTIAELQTRIYDLEAGYRTVTNEKADLFIENTQLKSGQPTSKLGWKEFLLNNIGDAASVAKLANFWTKQITGSETEESRNITTLGSTVKNVTGAFELPEKVWSIGEKLSAFRQGVTAKRVVEFVDSLAGAGKSFFDGVELAGTRLGLISKDLVGRLSFLSGLGALSFGTTQVALNNAPNLARDLNSGHVGGAFSNFLKLIKHITIAAVGALALTAFVFAAVPALTVTLPFVATAILPHASVASPLLLTTSLAAGVSDRLFNGIMKGIKG